MIQNKYAIHNDKIISISEVFKNNRNNLFICPGCGDLLIPRLGGIREHHFYHKNNNSCNYETYLHKISKLTLFNSIQLKLNKKQNLNLELQQTVKCKTCLFSFSNYTQCEIGKEVNSYNILNRYNQVFLEKNIGEFRPDIVLMGEQDILFIEICVTHKSEFKKISSKNKIIEFYIEDETQIESLNSFNISKFDCNTELFNFDVKPIYKKITEYQCPRSIDIFVVTIKGKAFHKTYSYYDYKIYKKHFIYVKKYDDRYYNANIYVSDILEAYNEGIKIRNCHLCRYHGFARKHSKSQSKKIFCKFLKRNQNSNDAVECDFYRLDEECFTTI